MGDCDGLALGLIEGGLDGDSVGLGEGEGVGECSGAQVGSGTMITVGSKVEGEAVSVGDSVAKQTCNSMERHVRESKQIMPSSCPAPPVQFCCAVAS